MTFPKSPVFLLALPLLLAPLSAGAVDPAPAPSPSPAVSPGQKADMLVWIEDAEKKLLDLATATPEAKFAWRPGKGVRSVGDVNVHVISANYNLPKIAGVKPPESFDAKTAEKTLTKKADIVAALRESFAHAKKALAETPDAGLDKPVGPVRQQEHRAGRLPAGAVARPGAPGPVHRLRPVEQHHAPLDRAPGRQGRDRREEVAA